MKRLAAIVIILSMGLSVGLGADAQTKKDKQLLNHLSIGVTAGVDGVGGQIALPVGSHLQLRGGYSLLLPRTFNTEFDTDNLPQGVRTELNVPSGEKINLSASLPFSTGKVLLDIFPTKKGGFHFTVGAHIGGEDYLNIVAPLTMMDPADWNTTYIMVNGAKVGTDAQGNLKAGVKVPKVNPYAGLGFGRAISSNSRKFVTFTMDLGVIYTGGKHSVYVNDLNGNPVQIDGQAIKDISGGKLNGQIQDIVDKALGLPVIPMLRFALNVKLF